MRGESVAMRGEYVCYKQPHRAHLSCFTWEVLLLGIVSHMPDCICPIIKQKRKSHLNIQKDAKRGSKTFARLPDKIDRLKALDGRYALCAPPRNRHSLIEGPQQNAKSSEVYIQIATTCNT